jgi:hypothetical protein
VEVDRYGGRTLTSRIDVPEKNGNGVPYQQKPTEEQVVTQPFRSTVAERKGPSFVTTVETGNRDAAAPSPTTGIFISQRFRIRRRKGKTELGALGHKTNSNALLQSAQKTFKKTPIHHIPIRMRECHDNTPYTNKASVLVKKRKNICRSRALQLGAEEKSQPGSVHSKQFLLFGVAFSFYSLLAFSHSRLFLKAQTYLAMQPIVTIFSAPRENSSLRNW